jgi:hypothetical protein
MSRRLRANVRDGLRDTPRTFDIVEGTCSNDARDRAQAD